MSKLEEFDKIVAEMRATLIRKNHDYGDENITSLGIKGVFCRIWDKVCRLKRLVWEEREAKVNESVMDTLQDLANYAIIGIILLRDKWKGR